MSASRTGRRPLQDPPPGAKEYTVQAEDSLEHIAVKFDMTTAELRRLNRLHGSSMIFPGQILFVRLPFSEGGPPPDEMLSPLRRGPSVRSTAQGSVSATPAAGAAAVASAAPTASPIASQPQATPVPITNGPTVSQTTSTSAPAGGSVAAAAEPVASVAAGRTLSSSLPRSPAAALGRSPSTALQTTAARALSFVAPEHDRITETELAIHCLFLTDGWGVCPGWLTSNARDVRFVPDEVPLVQENGRQPYSLHFEVMDVVCPVVQEAPPNLSESASLSPAPSMGTAAAGSSAVKDLYTVASVPLGSGQPARARANTDPTSRATSSSTSGAAAGDGSLVDDLSRKSQHMFLQLPVRVIFGQPISPATVQPYWFAISRDLVDGALGFFLRICPVDLLQEFPEASGEPELLNYEDAMAPVPAPLTPLAHLLTPSVLLESELFYELLKTLPRSLQLSDWQLIFSARDDGCSLSAFYRKMSAAPSATIMLLRDRGGAVFGCFASKAWELSERFYGNGECSLFQLKPAFRVYHWTGANKFFQMGKRDGLCMGSGEGAFGLWVDDMFDKGSSAPCSTFGNECLASKADFVISDFEVYAAVCSD